MTVPAVDDDEVVDALLDLREQVAAHQHRAPLPGEPPQERPQPGDALGVEAVRGLVEDQHARVAQQRGGEGEALSHAQRAAAHRATRGVRQPDQAEHPSTAVGRPERGGARPQVRAPGARRVEALRLQHRADHRAGRGELREPRAVDLASPEVGRPGRGSSSASWSCRSRSARGNR